MANVLLGKNFTPPDVYGKVTGKAKYAEDFRAEGMLFCRLLTSPMPHGRVRTIDASAALAMEGVVAILTADELPEVPAPRAPILTNEPHYVVNNGTEPAVSMVTFASVKGMPNLIKVE